MGREGRKHHLPEVAGACEPQWVDSDVRNQVRAERGGKERTGRVFVRGWDFTGGRSNWEQQLNRRKAKLPALWAEDLESPPSGRWTWNRPGPPEAAPAFARFRSKCCVLPAGLVRFLLIDPATSLPGGPEIGICLESGQCQLRGGEGCLCIGPGSEEEQGWAALGVAALRSLGGVHTNPFCPCCRRSGSAFPGRSTRNWGEPNWRCSIRGITPSASRPLLWPGTAPGQSPSPSTCSPNVSLLCAVLGVGWGRGVARSSLALCKGALPLWGWGGGCPWIL